MPREPRGWDEIPERQERIDREAVREYDARERFRLRAEGERQHAQALERSLQQALDEKQRAERKAADENAVLARMRAVLGDVVRMRGQLAAAADEQREILATADATIQIARASDSLRRKATKIPQVLELIRNARIDLNRFEEAQRMATTSLQDCEAAAKETKARIAEAERTVKEQEASLKRTQKRLAQKERLIGEAEEIATMEWPAERKAREVLYLRDLSLFLKEALPSDRVVLSPPSEPETGRPFISVRLLCDAPTNGSVIIVECAPMRLYGRFVLHAAPANDDEVEVFECFKTLREVADALQAKLLDPQR